MDRVNKITYIADENDLIDEMRGKYKELLSLEKIEDENVKTTKDVAEINRDIDDPFKQADEEHKLVVQLSEEAQKLHDQVTEAFKTIAALTAEANKKHEEYLEQIKSEIGDLKNVGVKDVAFIVGGVMPEKVRDYYGDGGKFGVRIKYVEQEKPGGIAQAVGLTEAFVGKSPFIVYLGDNLLKGHDFKTSQRGVKSDMSYGGGILTLAYTTNSQARTCRIPGAATRGIPAYRWRVSTAPAKRSWPTQNTN
jgi:hypothetical protein